MPLKITVNRASLDRGAALLRQAGNAADRIVKSADSVKRAADAKVWPATHSGHAAKPTDHFRSLCYSGPRRPSAFMSVKEIRGATQRV